MKILLFGGGLQVLTIAQSLKSCDYRVFVAGKNNEVSKHCRYVDKCFDVDIDNLDVLDFINVIKSGDYQVVIPMEDEYATWLSKNKEIMCMKEPFKITYTFSHCQSKEAQAI